jgi:hypothetical protein
MPDPSDPKWVEENYKIADRKCRVSCGVCHVNPSGGMLRNDTGYFFGTKTLPWKTDIPEGIQASLKKVKSDEFITFGGDFRLLTLFEEDRDDNPLIFPMQGDLYVRANLHKHLVFLTQIGLTRGDNDAVREIMGIAGDFPFNSYLKIGKFIPPYGHKLDDHTAFIRSKINFDQSQPETYLSGLEVGLEPLLLFGRFSYFNEDTNPSGSSDRDMRGVSAVAGWRGLWLHLGASFIDIINFETTSRRTTDRSAYGIFGGLRYKRLSYLFEVDIRRDDIIDPTGSTRDEEAFITFNELTYRVLKGFNIKLRYETFAPDDDSTEKDEDRFIVGLDFFPYPFTEINLQYRLNDEGSEETTNDFLFLTHIWF